MYELVQGVFEGREPITSYLESLEDIGMGLRSKIEVLLQEIASILKLDEIELESRSQICSTIVGHGDIPGSRRRAEWHYLYEQESMQEEIETPELWLETMKSLAISQWKEAEAEYDATQTGVEKQQWEKKKKEEIVERCRQMAQLFSVSLKQKHHDRKGSKLDFRMQLNDVRDVVSRTTQSIRSLNLSPNEELLDLEQQLEMLLRIFTNPPSVTVVGDKEAENFNALWDELMTHPSLLQVGGVVVPGGNLDRYFYDPTLRFRAERKLYHQGGVDIFRDHGGYLMYRHQPYDFKKLKDPLERFVYNIELLKKILASNPDTVFLSNFKLILDGIIPEFLSALQIAIVNVHPSVLPLNKGWRTEGMAFKDINPGANGYTFHHVVPELDSGAVLFSRHVPVDSYDPDIAARKESGGHKEEVGAYEKRMEEIARWKIIHDQSKFTPRVLAAVSSDLSRKIVEDTEAFTYEGRPDFESSCEYRELLRKEYTHWTKSTGDEVDYEEWYQSHRIPYRRILFDAGNGWQTLEEILEVEKVVEQEELELLKLYVFKVPIPAGATDEETTLNAMLIYSRLKKALRNVQVVDEKWQQDFNFWHIQICSSDAIEPLLEDFEILDFTSDVQHVSVVVPRKAALADYR